MWTSRFGLTWCYLGFQCNMGQKWQGDYKQLTAFKGTFTFIQNTYYLLTISGRHSLRYWEYKDTYVTNLHFRSLQSIFPVLKVTTLYSNSVINSLIKKMRKLRCRMISWLVPGHSARKHQRARIQTQTI